jgi:hypothetical protein
VCCITVVSSLSYDFRLAQPKFGHRGKIRFFGKRNFLRPLNKQMMNISSYFLFLKFQYPNSITKNSRCDHSFFNLFAFCSPTFGPSEALAEQCTFRLSLSPSRVFARRTCRRYIEKGKYMLCIQKICSLAIMTNLESISTDNIKRNN